MTKLLKEAPSDGEGLDFSSSPTTSASRSAAISSRSERTPSSTRSSGARSIPDMVARLAKIARETQDAPLLQATLGVLVALGRDEPGIAEELSSLDARAAKVPQIMVDQRVLLAIGDRPTGVRW